MRKNPTMSNQTNLTDARNNLADICAQVVADREVMIITQPNGENVALIAADELASLLETTHLLRSPSVLILNPLSHKTSCTFCAAIFL
jgi:antitoxin YefM